MLNDSVFNPTYLGIGDELSWIAGDNIGATSEEGEPVNYGKTVWFRWIAPDDTWQDVWYFSTREDRFASTGYRTPDFATAVQIFVQNVSGSPWPIILTPVEQPFFAQERDPCGFAGSEVLLMPVRNKTYYIRVDGYRAEEGQFVLSWGKWRNKIFYPWDHPEQTWRPRHSLTLPDYSYPRFAREDYCGHIQLGDVRRNTFTQDFGIFPAGEYIIRYHSGAWLNNLGVTTGPTWSGAWSVWADLPNLVATAPYLGVLVNGALVLADIGNAVLPQSNFDMEHRPDFFGSLVGDTHYAFCEWTNFGAHCRLTLTGGDSLVQLRFSRSAGLPQNHQNGYDVDSNFINPIFVLYRLPEFSGDPYS